jgi:hypothetical protein
MSADISQASLKLLEQESGLGAGLLVAGDSSEEGIEVGIMDFHAEAIRPETPW